MYLTSIKEKVYLTLGGKTLCYHSVQGSVKFKKEIWNIILNDPLVYV